MAEVIPHWLTKQADLDPDGIAVECENGDIYTFQQIKIKSEQFARKLIQIGIKQGTHVGILSTNQIEMIITIHALSYLNAVSVLLNTRLTTEELNYQVKDADVSVLLVADALMEQAKGIDINIKKSFSEVEALEERNTKLVEELNLDDLFSIIYTSGTTGNPKGVVHTYGNHWWSAIGSALNLGLNKEDKWLIPLPLFHVSGLSTMLKGIIYGMPIFLMEKFKEERVIEAIESKGITIISVVTVMLQRMMAKQERFADSLRCVLLGGGSAPKPMLEEAKKRNIPVFQSYGMTETSSQIVTLSPQHALEKIGSAGKPLFPAQIKIDKTSEEGIGEILVKGPMVTKGYYKNESANDKSFFNGWLATGDIGYLDEEGFLYVMDRRKDLIISGGENIYPSEIESVLTGMKQIKEAGVTGKADPTWGQVPVAFIVQQADVTKEEIFHYLQPRLAKYKWPKEIHFVEKLPRNASNKLVRNKLLDLQKE